MCTSVENTPFSLARLVLARLPHKTGIQQVIPKIALSIRILRLYHTEALIPSPIRSGVNSELTFIVAVVSWKDTAKTQTKAHGQEAFMSDRRVYVCVSSDLRWS